LGEHEWKNSLEEAGGEAAGRENRKESEKALTNDKKQKEAGPDVIKEGGKQR